MNNYYDLLVIGGGPAGYIACINAAKKNLKVALIEKNIDNIGGTCLNEGCIPVKSLIKSADVFDTIKNNDLFDISITHKEISIQKFLEKNKKNIDQIKKGLLFLFKKNNIDLIEGFAKFLDKNSVQITKKNNEKVKFQTHKILIATGSIPKTLSDLCIDNNKIITSEKVIELKDIPHKMLIIGSGAIGVEFASFFNSLNVDITIIDSRDSLIPFTDKDISRRLESIFLRQGIKVFTNSIVEKLKIESNKINVTIKNQGKQMSDIFDKVLLCIGRIPNTLNMNLDKIGVNLDNNGFIVVNKSFQTNIKNIYAVGDVINTPMLAHVASMEAKIAIKAIITSKNNFSIDYNSVPNAIYTDVQVASVGYTEDELKKLDNNYVVEKHFFKTNGMAIVNGKTEGFIKLIVNKDNKQILGAHIIGYKASELIHEFVLAKKNNISIDKIVETVHAHPTYSESILDVCEDVLEKFN